MIPLPHEDGGEDWDRLVLGGVTFTGKVVVTGDAIKKKLDKRRSRGADGARVTDQGFDLRDVRVVLTGWTEEHAGQLDDIMLLLAPPSQSASRRNALAISYPSLLQMLPPITQVLVDTVGLLEMGDGVQFTQEFTLVEYRQPSARNVTHAPQPAPEAQIDPAVQQVFTQTPIPAPSGSSTGP